MNFYRKKAWLFSSMEVKCSTLESAGLAVEQIHSQDLCLWKNTTKLLFDHLHWFSALNCLAEENKFGSGDLRPQKCPYLYSSFLYIGWTFREEKKIPEHVSEQIMFYFHECVSFFQYSSLEIYIHTHAHLTDHFFVFMTIHRNFLEIMIYDIAIIKMRV